jgi:hypothetical protein
MWMQMPDESMYVCIIIIILESNFYSRVRRESFRVKQKMICGIINIESISQKLPQNSFFS